MRGTPSCSMVSYVVRVDSSLSLSWLKSENSRQPCFCHPKKLIARQMRHDVTTRLPRRLATKHRNLPHSHAPKHAKARVRCSDTGQARTGHLFVVKNRLPTQAIGSPVLLLIPELIRFATCGARHRGLHWSRWNSNKTNISIYFLQAHSQRGTGGHRDHRFHQTLLKPRPALGPSIHPAHPAIHSSRLRLSPPINFLLTTELFLERVRSLHTDAIMVSSIGVICGPIASGLEWSRVPSVMGEFLDAIEGPT